MKHLQGMKKVTIKPNQTIFDIASQEYGTCEAVGIILKENGTLVNDPAAKVAAGIDAVNDKGFYFDLPLETGAVIQIDTDSRLVRKSIIREIDKEVTTFNL